MKKVITYGSFDLFHEGHYKLLKRAKELGDYLIVGVTTEHFDTMRGKLNLVDPIMTRIENVRATGFADEIIVEDHDGQKIEDRAKKAGVTPKEFIDPIIDNAKDLWKALDVDYDKFIRTTDDYHVACVQKIMQKYV